MFKNPHQKTGFDFCGFTISIFFRKSVKKRIFYENPKNNYLSRTRRLPGWAKPVRASLRSPNGNCSHFPHMTRSISLKK